MRNRTTGLPRHFCRRLIVFAVLMGMLTARFDRPADASVQSRSSVTNRSVIEGTWQLEEWHVNGEVLKPPQADGRWSNRDGVVLFVLHRNDGANAISTVGYGTYQMDESMWSYRYDRMETSTGPVGGPAKVTVTQPARQMRSFKISRQGSKVVVEGEGDDRREYDGLFFTLFQKDKIVRKWRRVG